MIELYILVLITLTSANLTEVNKLPPSLQDEIYLKVPEIIAKYNYPVEVHNVETEDGYIVTLHRIPNPLSKKIPILVMHGILASSADWIITGPDKALGYQLAKEGYDVWLGNARGNRYSKNHTTLNVTSDEFWNFSFHEIAYYDVPAMIDHILKTTKRRKIFHIGHSQGTTTLYVMCSLRPEYNKIIKAHFSLAPVGFVSHMHSPFMQALAKAEIALRYPVKWIGLNEFMPQNGFVSNLAQEVCDKGEILETLCSNILFAICGNNPKQLNMTILPLILAHIPAGASTKQLLHYAQEINSENFCQYDYGWYSNFQKYRSWNPPNYDLSKINVSMYFFYSKNDWISSSQDVWKLASKLKTVRGKFLIADDQFDHMDYLFGIDANKLVYQKIISLMAKEQQKSKKNQATLS